MNTQCLSSTSGRQSCIKSTNFIKKRKTHFLSLLKGTKHLGHPIHFFQLTFRFSYHLQISPLKKSHHRFKRAPMRPSSIRPYIEALVKKFFFDLIVSFCSASSKTSKSKFLAHLVEVVKN
jgi:hypothetical protein